MKHFLFAVSLALPLPVMAQTAMPKTMDHSGHQMAGDQSPASLAFAAANTKMHADMNAPLTGNPDVDFAQGVIDAQEAEIAWMTEWLAKNRK